MSAERAEIIYQTEVLTAERIARDAHDGQTEESTGDDYIKHVERVVDLVDDEAKAAAWLHDVIEDSNITEGDLLRLGIPERTVRAVVLLTREENEHYADYIWRLKHSSDSIAISVKIADLKDHLRPNCPARLRPRYEKAWEVLIGRPAEVAAHNREREGVCGTCGSKTVDGRCVLCRESGQ